MARAARCNDPLLLHRADVWAASQEGTGSFWEQPPFRRGRVKCYLSSPVCHFHPVLGHCSSRRRQFQPQVLGNWKPSACSFLLPAHLENLNLWLDNVTWSCHSTVKAALSLRCGKSMSACHAAVAVHRRWWSLKDWKRTWPGTCYVLAFQAVLILHPCVIH